MPQSNMKVTLSASLGNFPGTMQQAAQAANMLNTKMNQLAAGMNNATVAGSKITATLVPGINVAFSSINNLTKATGAANTASRGFFGMLGTAGGRAVGVLGGGLAALTRGFGLHSTAVNVSANAYKGLVGQVINMNRFMNLAFASIRQIGQGLQNFGVMFTVFVSAPITLALKSITSGLINFQDQLIEVRKTAGISNVDLKKLSDNILAISQTSPTSAVDLGKIAADWGRAGISGVNALAAITAETDKFVIATDLAADDVVSSVSRIGNIYFKTVDEIVKAMPKLASMINILGQQNPAGEKDILEAMTRAAPFSKTVGVSLPDLAGFITTTVGQFVSAERAGTDFGSAILFATKNTDKFASAMNTTEDAIRSAMDTDFTGWLIDVFERLQAVESGAKRNAITAELFGTVGAKSILGMIENLGYLKRNIDAANKSFEDGTSIQIEYERALDSVKNQLAVVRNNLFFVGSIFGEVILPYITKFTALAVPALQMAADRFKSLSESTKLWSIGIAGLLAILGPLIVMLGTVMFSIGIIGTGISTMVANFLMVFFNIGKLAVWLLGLLSPLNLVVIGIGAVIAAAIYMGETFAQTGGIISDVISQTYEWGKQLFITFAHGISAAAQYVYDAVVDVINNFVGLIQAFSPPKEGPLQHVLTWSKNTGEAIGDGLRAAIPKVKSDAKDLATATAETIDEGLEAAIPMTISTAYDLAMGIVNAVRGTIEGLSPDSMDMFSTIFSGFKAALNSIESYFTDEKNPFDVSGWLKKGAEQIANFLNAVDNGGNATLSGLKDILGGMTGDFERLVDLQNKYADASERLEQVKDALKGLDAETENQIMAIARRTDLTLSQRSAMIRRIKIDAEARKKDLEDQKDTAEEEKDIAKDRVDSQKQLISILQSLMQSNTAKKEKKLKEDDLAGELDLGIDETDTSKLSDVLSDMDQSMGEFLAKIAKGRDIVDGFFRGLRGDEFDPGMLNQMSEGFIEGFRRGHNIFESVTGFLDKVASYKEVIKQIGAGFWAGWEQLKSGLIAGFLDEFDEKKIENVNALWKALYYLGYYMGVAAAGVSDLINRLHAFFTDTGNGDKTGFQKMLDNIRETWNNFVDGFTKNGTVEEKLRKIIEPLAIIFGILSTTVNKDNLINIAWFIGVLTGVTVDMAGDLFTFAAAVAQLIESVLTGKSISGAIDTLERLSGWASGLQVAFSFIKNAFDTVLFPISGEIQTFVTTTGLMLDDWKALFDMTGLDIWGSMTGGVSDMTEAILANIADFVLGIGKSIVLLLKIINLGAAGLQTLSGTQASFDRAQALKQDFLSYISADPNVTGDLWQGVSRDLAMRDVRQEQAVTQQTSGKADDGWWSNSWFNPNNWGTGDDSPVKQSETGGMSMGQAIAEGFKTQVENPATATIMSDSIKTATSISNSTVLPEMTSAGTGFAKAQTDAFTDLWGGPAGQDALNTTTATLDAWIIANKELLNTQGVLIGKLIINGMIEAFNDLSKPLQQLLDSLEKWSTDASVSSLFKIVGHDIGLVLVDGIIQALSDSSSRLRQELNNIFGIGAGDAGAALALNGQTVKYNSTPPAGYVAPNLFNIDNSPNDDNDPFTIDDPTIMEVWKSSWIDPAQNTQAGGSPIVVNINVDSGSISDKRKADELAQAIRRELSVLATQGKLR